MFLRCWLQASLGLLCGALACTPFAPTSIQGSTPDASTDTGCVPRCSGGACGLSDGCGGSCDGTCPTGESCVGGGCEKPLSCGTQGLPCCAGECSPPSVCSAGSCYAREEDAAADTGSDDATAPETGADLDTGIDLDTGVPPPTDASGPCLLVTPRPSSAYCGIQGGARSQWPIPSAYCVYDENSSGAPVNAYTEDTPPACECEITFTCACLEAQLPNDVCQQQGLTVANCYDTGDGPVVYCK